MNKRKPVSPKHKTLNTISARDANKPLSKALIRMLVENSGPFELFDHYYLPTGKLIFRYVDNYSASYDLKFEIPVNSSLHTVLHAVNQMATKIGMETGKQDKINEIKKVLEIEPSRKYSLKEL